MPVTGERVVGTEHRGERDRRRLRQVGASAARRSCQASSCHSPSQSGAATRTSATQVRTPVRGGRAARAAGGHGASLRAGPAGERRRVTLARMTLSADRAAWFRARFTDMADNMGLALLGKDRVIRLTLTCLVSEGHLLLEDLPGTGKTMLARALANTVEGSHARIQFTPDLLPSDVTGVTVYDQHKGSFEFHPGPIFHDIVLADEINRASPKTQSALLEVMEEGHVTVDGIDLRRPAAVHGHRHPEPDRAGRHLPAARGPARPVPDEDLGRLPRRRVDRGAAAGLADPRPGRAGQAGHHHRPGRRDGRAAPTRCTSTGRSSATSASSPRPPARSRTSGSDSVRARLPRADPGRQDLGRVRRPHRRRARGHRRPWPSRCSCHRLLLDAAGPVRRRPRWPAWSRTCSPPCRRPPTAAERACRARRAAPDGRPRDRRRVAPSCCCSAVALVVTRLLRSRRVRGDRRGSAPCSCWPDCRSSCCPPAPAGTCAPARPARWSARSARARSRSPTRAGSPCAARWSRSPSAPAGHRPPAAAASGSTAREAFDVPAYRRGVLSVGPARVRRSDPLGLYARATAWTAPVELLVRPRMVALEGLALGSTQTWTARPATRCR